MSKLNTANVPTLNMPWMIFTPNRAIISSKETGAPITPSSITVERSKTPREDLADVVRYIIQI